MSKFQDQVAKPRASRGHKRILDGGRKDLIKYGAPFSSPRTVDQSNAFVAKEEYSSNVDDEIEEASAMSGGSVGSVEGSAGGFLGIDAKKANEKHKKDLKKKNEGTDMQSREEMVDELNEFKVRKTVSRMLELQKKRFIKSELGRISENFKLRKVLSRLISESDVENSPHQSTAINKLEALLDKIRPQIEDVYKTLTTATEQRESFRAHILNAVLSLLKEADTNRKAGSGKLEGEEDIDLSETPEELEEVEISIKPTDPLDASDEDKFIPGAGAEGGDKEDPADEELDPKEEFGIEGAELTGRDSAFEVFKQIQSEIERAYNSLYNENDREVFTDYLITNLKMHMDNFEKSISTDVEEPASDSYEPQNQEEPEELDQL